jgi:predicted N-acetyltransferase YhbS
VRTASESDRQAISNIVIAAFGAEEGNEINGLIADLLADPSTQPLLSLVAAADDNAVGHILFTNAWIKHSQRMISSTILAPLSVHPEYQRQNIGGLLIQEGRKRLKAIGVELIFVLGHPDYYPKYGFSAAGTWGFVAPYPIPPEHADA